MGDIKANFAKDVERMRRDWDEREIVCTNDSK
jgi:hypothetical protein